MSLWELVIIDPEHGHILTGDIQILCNNKLKKLITNDPRYRGPSTICWDKAKSLLTDGMNGAAEQLSNKLDINKLQFSECSAKPDRFSD